MPPLNASKHRPVKALPPEVARKIAAGEVIDRPNAIVRELLDNAVDSGADTILAEITGGGIERIRIVDNGEGMTKEDLEVCAHPHATSKITVEEDLLTLSTLGFRGEALSSIAAVSRLQITSSRGGEAWRLEASVSHEHTITPANLAQGTIVQSEALFENFPARRVFLKRPSAETMLCRQTFIEKALPRTDISFRLVVDGKQRLDLPKGQSLAERFITALNLPESPSLFYELHASSATHGTNSVPDWKFSLIIGEPAVWRGDRKSIYIYVNGRRINEYSLMQAIEYGGQGFFPNGTHPMAVLFLEMNPALVDFNIHPAKREARFKDLAPVHHAVSNTTRNFFRDYSVSQLASQVAPGIHEEDRQGERLYGTPVPRLIDDATGTSVARTSAPHTASKAWHDDTDSFGRHERTARPCASQERQQEARQDIRRRFFSDSYCEPGFSAAQDTPKYPSGNESSSSTGGTQATDKCETTGTSTEQQPVHACTSASCGTKAKYIGSVLGVFIIMEKDGCLYLIDQHAAHERILYNKFITAVGTKQPLLVPYVLETASEEDDTYLHSIASQLDEAGFDAKDCGDGRWEFSSVPAQWSGTEEDLASDLLMKRISPAEVLSSLAATNACRAAVKDGHILDPDTAANLALEALELQDPHCPHGRPIWTRITREELFQRVRRT